MLRLGGRRLGAEQRAGFCDVCGAAGVGEEPIVADAVTAAINGQSLLISIRYMKEVITVPSNIPTLPTARFAVVSATARSFFDVASHPDSNPDDVHKRIVRPLTTVKNNLVALHALDGVIGRGWPRKCQRSPSRRR
jgi:hypothetical protein